MLHRTWQVDESYPRIARGARYRAASGLSPVWWRGPEQCDVVEAWLRLGTGTRPTPSTTRTGWHSAFRGCSPWGGRRRGIRERTPDTAHELYQPGSKGIVCSGAFAYRLDSTRLGGGGGGGIPYSLAYTETRARENSRSCFNIFHNGGLLNIQHRSQMVNASARGTPPSRIPVLASVCIRASV